VSKGLEDLLGGRRQTAEQQRVNHVDQLRAREHVLHVMQDLQSDPRWVVLADHIIAEGEQLKKQIEYITERLVGGEFLDPKQYGNLKISLANLTGYHRGIERVLTLMADLIKTGEIAKEKIAELSQE
jgi:hypothetical protein